MKVAILMAGYLRTIQNNLQSIKDNLIADHQVDFYIHITNNEFLEDRYSNKITSLDYIKENLNPKLIIVEDNKKYKNYNTIYNQFYKFYKLNLERKATNIKYDVIFKLRPDVYLHQKIKLEINDLINIPIDTKSDKDKIGDNQELCDIIAFGKPDKMDKYFDIYKHLNELINDKINKPETLLYKYLDLYSIKYKKLDIRYSVILSLCNSIAITGDSGSGKSTISKLIKSLFDSSFVLECDRYHKWERGNQNWKKMTHLNPEANYLAKMEKDVFDLKIGKKVYQVDYDHNSGKFTEKELIESSPNIIVCGLHTMYTINNYNIKIFMDTDEELKIKWKIERDMKERAYSREKILKNIEDRKEDYIKYILPQKKEADLIINYKLEDDNLILNLGVLKKYKVNYNHQSTKIIDDFIWYKFNKGNYEEIILTFIKKILT